MTPTRPSFEPADSLASLKADLRVCRARYGNLRNWPLVRGHLVNRLANLRPAK